MHRLGVSKLSGAQIQEGWLEHMWSDDFNKDGNNFLWVSNENAYELMRKGVIPPETGDPDKNPEFDMIDAQLTTEIFGLFAPGSPEVALEIAELPILTTARENAKLAAEFYVIMHSLAAVVPQEDYSFERLVAIAEVARRHLPKESYLADMYDFIKMDYLKNPDKDDWERTRDAVYQRYQTGKRGWLPLSTPI